VAVIDVGPGAINRASNYSAAQTLIDLNNPANDTGSLDTFELWPFTGYSLANCKVGTFYEDGAAGTYISRDYATIGAVTAGSKQTFSGLSIDVESGDYAGQYSTAGYMEADTSGFAGFYSKSGDQFGAGSQTYILHSGDAVSIYATGTTVAATSIKALNGTAIANIAKWNGIAIGSYKTINGISNVS